ncbi:alpha/beta hydrolase [Ectothiorhodospiraceae bacterium WFHF3C12]|nr:alpha/beta hydrolase [Ectothiorhodospiraceae bacterium WFHF3C12]
MTEPTRPVLFFAHANGFPAGSYRRFLAPLESRFDVRAPEKLGHHPDYPPHPNWSALADELLDALAAETAEPAVGVGHSLGGVLTLLAAIRQPRRFRCFVMLDPPVVFGPRAWMTGLAKRLGFIDRVTPAGRTAGRRDVWPDRERALAYFRSKGLFARFDPRCLEDYVDAGTVTTDEGLRLVYEPEREVENYRNVPHDLAAQPAPVPVPGAIVLGRESIVTRPGDTRRLARRQELRISEHEGGHMFPLEHPESAAAHVEQVVESLLAAAQTQEEAPRRRQ